MPSCCATRRASSTSATEQQPESLDPPHSFIVAPTTSWPSSCSSAAATDESTPPDIATSTLATSRLPEAGDGVGHDLAREVDVLLGRRHAEGEAHAARGLARGDTHRR